MIENHELCPCGSGDTVQQCCGRSEGAPGVNQIQEELKKVLNGYYEMPLQPSEINELEQMSEKWIMQLGEWMEEDEVLANVSDYYFFIVRKDRWRRHLVKALNRTQNRAVRSILKSWQNSFVTFAEVAEADDSKFKMKEILGEGEYFLRKEPGEPEDVKALFAIALEEQRGDERWVMPVSAIAANQHMSEDLMKQVQELAKSSNESNSFDFFKNYYSDILEIVCKLDSQTLMEVVEQNFTPLQREVVEILDKQLENETMYPGAYEMLLSLVAYYFTDQSPRFRKPEVIAAAAFQLASDFEMMENSYTQGETGKLFGVSVSSFKKHTDVLADKIEELEELMGEEGPVQTYYAGTDPRPTEQMNWQVHVLMGDQNFDTMEEAQAFMQQAIQKPFEPADRKQEAQLLSYLAYSAETEEQRRDFAEQAYGADPKLTDVLLLQAEMTANETQQEALLLQAVEAGEKEFDDRAEDTWAFVTNRPYLRALLTYGVWLFERKRFSESSDVFMKLLQTDLHDHQGARYLAISSLLNEGQLEFAENAWKASAEISEGSAAQAYLAWLLEMDKTEGESTDKEGLFEKAEQLNPYVAALLHTDAEKLPYPRKADIQPGSPEEAYYIWYLL